MTIESCETCILYIYILHISWCVSGFVIWRVLRGTQDRYIVMCACWDVLFITSMNVLFWVNYPKSLLPLSFSDVLNISILRGHHLGNVEFHHLSARDQWVPLFHPKRLWLATISTKSLDKVLSLNTKYIKDSFPSNFGTLILLDNLNISNFHMLHVWKILPFTHKKGVTVTVFCSLHFKPTLQQVSIVASRGQAVVEVAEIEQPLKCALDHLS